VVRDAARRSERQLGGQEEIKLEYEPVIVQGSGDVLETFSILSEAVGVLVNNKGARGRG